MDWLKQHYDRAALISAALLLLLSALYLTLATPSLEETFVAPTAPTSPAVAESDPALTEFQASLEAFRNPRRWEPADGSLFVSRVYLLRDGALFDPLEGDSPLHAPVPNSWIVAQNLDYTDPNLLARDTDADGFTVLEEWQGKTNPNDPASRPPVWTKLRLQSSKIDKLRLLFTGLPAGELTEVSINTVREDDPAELSGSTQIYRAGQDIKLAERDAAGKEVFRDTGLRFERAEMKTIRNDKIGSDEEVPVITLRNKADGRAIQLTRGEIKDSPYSLATLVDTRNGETHELRVGEQFTLQDAGTYKLIDVTPNEAVLMDAKSGEKLRIPAAS